MSVKETSTTRYLVHYILSTAIGRKLGLQPTKHLSKKKTKYEEAFDALGRKEDIGVLVFGNHLSKKGGECLEYMMLDDKRFVRTDENLQPSSNIQKGHPDSVEATIGKDKEKQQKVFGELLKYIESLIKSGQVVWLDEPKIEEIISKGVDQSKITRSNYQSIEGIEIEIYQQSTGFRRDRIRAEYKCTENGCTFITDLKNQLKYHMKRHAGVYPIKCPNCEYGTDKMQKLNLHMKKHDPNAKFKFNCDDCGYKTDYKTSLESHIRSRHALQCNQCDFKSHRQYDLNRHITEKHTNKDEKQFKCNECEYETNRKDNLNRHIKKMHA